MKKLTALIYLNCIHRDLKIYTEEAALEMLINSHCRQRSMIRNFMTHRGEVPRWKVWILKALGVWAEIPF